MKRTLSLLLAVSLLLVMLTACGGTTNPTVAPSGAPTSAPTKAPTAAPTNQPTPDPDAFIGYSLPLVTEKTVITMAASKRADVMDFALLPYFEMVQEATGIEIAWEIYDRDNGWPEQRGLMMTANSYPDCFYGAAGFVASDMIAYGATGRFMPLNDLIEKYGINIISVFEKRPDIQTYITAPDDNIYHIPIVDESGLILGSTPFINKEWLAETGLGMPTDTGSMLEVLRAMKDKGHATPFGFQDLGGNTGFLQFSALFGVNIFEPDEYCVVDDKVVFGPATTAFKDTLNYLHILYSEGLMDVESLTQDRATFQAKSRSEPPTYGLYPAWSRQWMIGSTDMPNYALYELIPPMKNSDGNIMWNYQNTGIGNSGFIITDKCKVPELAYCWIDYQAEPNISIQATGGMFGEGYTLNADGTITTNDPPEGMSTSDYRAAACPGVSGFRIILADEAKRILPGADAAERQGNFEIYRDANAFNFPLFNVPFYLSEDDAETVDLIQVDIDGYVEETIGRWIVNGNVDAEWDGYVKQLYDYGLQTILDLYNEMSGR